MFYGEFEHTIDRKGRLIVPSEFREIFDEHEIQKVYVTRGLDGCLFLFAEEEWRLQEQRFKNMSFTKPFSRRFNRLFFSGASKLAVDKQGRVLIPQYLKDYALIKRDVVLIGVSNRIEIWSKDRWREFYASSSQAFEETAEKLMEA